MAREDLHFRLRIPEQLKQDVAAAAERNGHSMTAEIIERLSWTFSGSSYDNYGPRSPIPEEPENNNIDPIPTLEMNLASEREILNAFESGQWIDLEGDGIGAQFMIDMAKARIKVLEHQIEKLKSSKE